jgi:poly(3-hydroxybutyrate) depolymerase
MKTFKLMSILGLAGIAKSWTVTDWYTKATDSGTKYVTLTPKGSHLKTMLYLHGGGGSAEGSYNSYFVNY